MGSTFSAENKVIPARGKALIDTQLSIAVPPGTYGRIAPRSGLGKLPPQTYSMRAVDMVTASKFMIDTGAGVIDADYRGILFVLLFNLSDKDFEGDYISCLYINFLLIIKCSERGRPCCTNDFRENSHPGCAGGRSMYGILLHQPIQ